MGGGGGTNADSYCFFAATPLLKSVQRGERGCSEITKFERTYFMDGPFRFLGRIISGPDFEAGNDCHFRWQKSFY